MTEHTPVEIELNPQERRVYDKVRARVVPGARSRRSGLRDMLLLMPDLSVLLLRLLRDDRVAPGDKVIGLLGVGYVLSPIDPLPTFIFGPLGLVDDIVVLSAALSRILNHVHPDVVRQHWPGKGDALEAVQAASEWSERQVTGRLRGVVKRLLG
ncbi:MAG: DUF1232 domain-containing protein [Myxococcales bacterium]|nr:DUF1232 domain-containing protein [Myxococcales bacterium]